jgi:beta-mannosidase
MAEVFTMVSKRSVDKWWPNGYGQQKLYYIHVQWEDLTTNSVKFIDRKYWMSEKYIRIGFRTVKLVQENMDNGLSFYFQVNGVPMFMKGSNYIPAHILPEKAGDEERSELK